MVYNCVAHDTVCIQGSLSYSLSNVRVCSCHKPSRAQGTVSTADQAIRSRSLYNEARNVNLVKRSPRSPDDGQQLFHPLSFPRIILSTARGIIVLSRNEMFSFKILHLLDLDRIISSIHAIYTRVNIKKHGNHVPRRLCKTRKHGVEKERERERE